MVVKLVDVVTSRVAGMAFGGAVIQLSLICGGTICLIQQLNIRCTMGDTFMSRYSDAEEYRRTEYSSGVFVTRAKRWRRNQQAVHS